MFFKSCHSERPQNLFSGMIASSLSQRASARSRSKFASSARESLLCSFIVRFCSCKFIHAFVRIKDQSLISTRCCSWMAGCIGARRAGDSSTQQAADPHRCPRRRGPPRSDVRSSNKPDCCITLYSATREAKSCCPAHVQLVDSFTLSASV